MTRLMQDITFGELLSPSIASDPTIAAAAKALDGQVQEVTETIRLVELYARLDELSGPVLDLLAWQLHVDFWRPELTDQAKRNLIRSSIGWHRIKGTPAAVRRLFADIGVEARIIEWWQPEGVGLEPYTFAVRGVLQQPVLQGESWGPQTILALEDAIAVAKNERSWLAWLSLALELQIPLEAALQVRSQVRDSTRLRLSFFPLFDITRLDVRALDEDTPSQDHRVWDLAWAPFRLGRPWSLDTIMAEGAAGLGLDGLLPGVEGEPEPGLDCIHLVGGHTLLPLPLELDAAWLRSTDCSLRVWPDTRQYTAAQTGLDLLGDSVGLDEFPGLDDVPLDLFPLDHTLEVTHA